HPPSCHSRIPRPRHPLRSPHFPYTTLFRSSSHPRKARSISRNGALATTEPITPRAFTRTSALFQGTPIRPAVGSSRGAATRWGRSEEHTSELQSPYDLVCRLLLEKKKGENMIPSRPEWQTATGLVFHRAILPQARLLSTPTGSAAFRFHEAAWLLART